MLSSFESALLDRHLRGCPSCSAFAVGATEQTRLLRDAVLEVPTRRPVSVPSVPAHAIRRSAAGAVSTCLVAAAAAIVLVWPGAGSQLNHAGQSLGVGAAVMVVVAAEPSVGNANVVVPRLRLQPASIADGSVHGYFSAPV